MEWEVALIEWMQANLNSSGSLVKLLAFFGSEVGLLILVLVVMFCWKKEVGQKLALVVSAMNVWLPMIKSLVLRPRPYMEYPGRVKAEALPEKGASALDVAAQGYSFPSMHSASIPALYFTLAKEAKKKWLWLVAAVLTVSVGVSRSVAGMHYPTDVMAGWILGFAVIWIFTRLDRYIGNRFVSGNVNAVLRDSQGEPSEQSFQGEASKQTMHTNITGQDVSVAQGMPRRIPHKAWQYHLILLLSALPGLFYVRTNDYFTSLGCLIGAMAAIHFEQKYVNFQETRKIPAMILRMLGAILIFFLVNTLLKLPFDKQFLAGTSFFALLIRTARYAIILFLIMGVYPMLFPLFEQVGEKQ